MKIVVCVKYVPDAQADRRFTADNRVDRAGVDGLLSELDEYAVEAAVTLAEAGDGHTVTAVTMGPEQAETAIRKALQMGADAGVHVLDDALAGADAIATAKVLAAAIARLEPDLVLAGMASTDAGTSVVPAMIAARLGLPQLTFAGSLEIDGAGPGALVRIQRDGDTSTEVIESALPALVSVTDQINEPRYPNFKGIMGAKKKPVEVLGLAELGLAADQVGGAAAWSAVAEITKRPGRQAGQRITDDGTAGTQLVAYLAGAKLI